MEPKNESLMNSVVARKWGKEADFPMTFYGFPPTLEYSQALIGGDPHQDCYDWAIQHYFKPHMPLANALSICCGHGHVERLLAERGVFSQCLGLDLSPGAIQQATQQAHNAELAQLKYQVENINQMELPAATYDLVIAVGALHHLPAVEQVIAQLYKSLRPGGFLLANEYVGPNYQQFSPRQVELINAMIHLIPAHRRERFEYNYVPGWLWPIQKVRGGIKKYSGIDLWQVRKLWQHWLPWGARRFGKVYDYLHASYWRLTDPSEGVNSEKIIPSIQQHFQKVDIRPYNGSLLAYVLDPTYITSYDPQNPQHRQWMDLLIHIERELIALGEVASDNAFIIAQKG
jgi:SAM-dependent methyltransferase